MRDIPYFLSIYSFPLYLTPPYSIITLTSMILYFLFDAFEKLKGTRLAGPWCPKRK